MSMEYRRLGKSGLPVSALSYGSWVTFSNQMAVDAALETMTAAYDAGVNFFDNAEIYAMGKSEIIMGEALKRVNWPRDTYILSSKVFWGAVPDPKPTQHGLHRKHVFEACHDAMRRLQVDYLDLYFCHRYDPNVPMEELVSTMTDLIRQGKVLYWGTSEWTSSQIMEAYSAARQYNLVPPTMEQPEYNMFRRDRVELELEPLYERVGLGTTIWSPLYHGLLTGKYNDGIPNNSRATLPGYEWVGRSLRVRKGAPASPRFGSFQRSPPIWAPPQPDWRWRGVCGTRTSAPSSSARPASNRCRTICWRWKCCRCSRTT